MSDVVGKITGNFGIWQLRTVLIIYLCKIPASWFMACVIFTAPALRDGEFHCRQPGQVLNINKTTWINLAHPKNEYSNRTDYCNIYENAEERATNYYQYIFEKETVSDINSDTESGKTFPCEEFQYHSDYHSLVTQFDLVCDRDILIAWTQFFHLLGILLGGILATKLMILVSPKRVMLLGMITQIVCGLLTGLLDNFELHCFFRCMSAVCCALMFSAGGVIFTEITGGKYRTGVATLYDQFWAIGVILLPELASVFHSWIHIYIAISLPTFILIFLYPWIPDAPRWLLKRGRIEEVEKILIESTEINERTHTLPENLQQELRIQSEALKSNPPPVGWLELWKGPRAVIHMIACHLAMAIYVINFMGMLLNIRSFSREHLGVNTAITGLSEIIGSFIALFLVLNTKRKWMWAGIYNIIAGIIGCMGWFIPETMDEITRIALWMLISSIAKAGVSISQSMLMACHTELVPPSKKPTFSFSCVTFARIWLLTAPFINVLKVIHVAMSLSFFCILSIIGGIATCCIIPDTKPQSKQSKFNSISHQPQTVWTINPSDIEKTKL